MTGSVLAWGAGLVGLGLLAVLGAGCGDSDEAADPPNGGSMDDDAPRSIETAASVPADADVRLTRRITDPLPDDVVLRYQRINRGPDPRINVWWELTTGGDVFVVRHSSDTSDPDTPFGTSRPLEPAVSLGADTLDEVAGALDASGFAAQPAYQRQPEVEDGVFSVVTARRPDGTVHEVVYEAVRRPPLDTLEALTERIEEEP